MGLEQLGQELDELKRLQSDKIQIIQGLELSLQTFNLRKQKSRVKKQRLEDEIEMIANEIEENVADSRLGPLETTLAVRIDNH